MSKEILPFSGRKSERRKTVINVARLALAAGLSVAIISCAKDSNHAPDQKLKENLNPTPITLTVNKDRDFSDILGNNYARAGLAGALATAIGMSVSSYYLGKRHDERMLRVLRISGPLTMAVGASAGLVDSFTVISRHIPSSLFLASTFLIAGQQIINTFEHYKNPKIRTGALAAAAGLSSLGVTAFLAIR